MENIVIYNEGELELKVSINQNTILQIYLM